MKGKIKTFPAILMAVLMSCTLTQAQVTIGDDALPRTGLVLDMKKSHATGYTGGVLFPHAEITDLTRIPESFTEESALSINPTKQKDLEGMMVYNTKTDIDKGIVTGYYLWNGEKWKAISIAEPKKKEGVLSTVMGRSGHSYTTFLLDNGTRWMVENSKEGHHVGFGYGDKKGTSIRSNSETENVQALGANGYYYTWKQATAQTDGQYDACPEGWELPGKEDITALKDIVNADVTSSTSIAKWWTSGSALAGAFGNSTWRSWGAGGGWWCINSTSLGYNASPTGMGELKDYSDDWLCVRCIQKE